MEETKTCQERVSLGGSMFHFGPCGKAVKEDGLCGIHAGAAKRRKKSEERWKAEREADDAVRDELAKISEQVTAVTGLSHPVSSAYSSWGGSKLMRDSATISRAALEKLLELAQENGGNR